MFTILLFDVNSIASFIQRGKLDNDDRGKMFPRKMFEGAIFYREILGRRGYLKVI